MIDFQRWHVWLGVVGAVVGVVLACPPWGPWTRRRGLDVAVPATAAVAMLQSQGLVKWDNPVAAIGVVAIIGGFTATARPAAASEPRSTLSVGPVVAATMLVGLWATLPDTEAPLVGATVLIAALTLRWVGRAGLNGFDWATMLALATVVTVVGSAGRTNAIAGAVCCMAWPAMLVARPRIDTLPIGFRTAVVVAHVGCVAVGSRLVAHIESIPAWWTAVAIVGAMALMAALLARPT